MYKVLLVDDEPVIRDGLRVIVDWTAIGFEVVAAVCDGEQALAWLDVNEADLLVTDVKMPKVNGIELVGELRKTNSHLRVIVISGYDEFEYVRAMTPLGIENYLLKPINETEFECTLQNIAGKLLREKRSKAMVELDENLIRQNIINRWLYGTIGEQELSDRALFLGFDLDGAPYCPVMFRFPKDAVPVSRQISNDIFKTCQHILNDWPLCYCAQNYDGETLALFSGWNETAMILLARCVKTVGSTYDMDLLVAVGQHVELYWQVAQSFQVARKQAVLLDIQKYLGADQQNLEDKSPFSVRLAQYVLEHFREEISLKQIAIHFKGNAAYIGQIFKRDMGKSFVEYLKSIRLEKAKYLLRTTEKSTCDIAQIVGFTNPNYFFTIFKKETGISPTAYRKLHAGE